MQNKLLSSLSHYKVQTIVLLSAFVISRIIFSFVGIEFDYSALFRYWQFLDVDTLKNNLIAGVWYNHAQPPVFNLFLGIVLKTFGNHAELAFMLIFKLITVLNVLLLFNILKKITKHTFLPFLLSLVYLLSPATVLFEHELFYTSFVSFFFLCSCLALFHLTKKISLLNALLFFTPLVIISLTRSMYHVFLLITISTFLLFYFRNSKQLRSFITVTLLSVICVSGWYAKNYFIFGQFSTSSWMGMNISRNVLHENEISDSSNIASIPPFSPISHYKNFIQNSRVNEAGSWQVKDLVIEWKNDSLKNLSHIDYIEVSEKYKQVCLAHIKSKPITYAANVMQSAIIFFAPATMYSLTINQANKLKYYDVAYSLNLSHFAKNKQERRWTMVISAVPQFVLTLFVFFMLLSTYIKTKKINPLNVFIVLIWLFVFTTGSLFEHYENMRFRYELQPMFLLLVGQAILIYCNNKKKRNAIEAGA